MKNYIGFYPYPRIEDLQALHQWLSESDEQEREKCFGTGLPSPGMTGRRRRGGICTLLVNPLYNERITEIVNRALEEKVPFGRVGLLEDPQDIGNCCLYARVRTENPEEDFCDNLDYLRPSKGRFWEVEVSVTVLEGDKILIRGYSAEDSQYMRDIKERKVVIVVRLFPHGKSAAGMTAFSTTMSLLEKEVEAIGNSFGHLKRKYKEEDMSYSSDMIEKLENLDFSTILEKAKVNEDNNKKTNFKRLVGSLRKAVKFYDEFLPGRIRDYLEAAFTHHALALNMDDPYSLYIKPVIESQRLREVFFKKKRSKENFHLYEVPFASWFRQADERIWGVFPVMSRPTEIIVSGYEDVSPTDGNSDEDDKIREMKQTFHRMLVKREGNKSDMDRWMEDFENAVNEGMAEKTQPQGSRYTDKDYSLKLKTSKENEVEYSRPYDICYLFLKRIKDGKKMSVTNSTMFKNTEHMLEFYKEIKKKEHRSSIEEFWAGKARLEYGNNWFKKATEEVDDLYKVIVSGKDKWQGHWIEMVLYNLLPERSRHNLYMYSTKYLVNKKTRERVMNSMAEDAGARMLFAYDIYNTYKANGHMDEEIQDFLSQEPTLREWLQKYEPVSQLEAGMTISSSQALELERRRRENALLEG